MVKPKGMTLVHRASLTERALCQCMGGRVEAMLNLVPGENDSGRNNISWRCA